MNTGRRFRQAERKHFSLSEHEDIWSLENLKNLINLRVEGGPKWKKRKDFADSLFVMEEWGGDVLDSSWVASIKMRRWGEEVLRLKLGGEDWLIVLLSMLPIF